MNSPSERADKPTLGLILAAGFGSRLETKTGTVGLKPLLLVGGKPLILRVIESMHQVGCREIVIVTGYCAEELEAGLAETHDGRATLTFVDNPDYRHANGLSVWAARQRLTETFILSMSDHLVSPTMMEMAANHQPLRAGATLLVDRKIDRVFDLGDATKVASTDGKITAIGKQLTTYDCIDTGLFVGTPGLVEAIGKVANERGDASLSEGVQRLAEAGRMELLDVGDANWMDVDTPEMLADAEQRLSQLE